MLKSKTCCRPLQPNIKSGAKLNFCAFRHFNERLNSARTIHCRMNFQLRRSQSNTVIRYKLKMLTTSPASHLVASSSQTPKGGSRFQFFFFFLTVSNLFLLARRHHSPLRQRFPCLSPSLLSALPRPAAGCARSRVSVLDARRREPPEQTGARIHSSSVTHYSCSTLTVFSTAQLRHKRNFLKK